ncbi:MAG: GNAT family N-acetyltransferase [Ruminococcus flavefaciens]|nr:GNAT family N-acetyltransferase [Ruminococcus flavefaciens]
MPMQEIAAKIERKQLLEELELLKKLDSDGKEVVTKEEILRVVEAKEKELLEEIRYLEKKEEALIGGEYDISLFDENILCEDSEIILRKPIDNDLDPYYFLKKEYAYMKSAFAKPEFKDELWQEYLSDESLYYTIAKKGDNIFIGYCGVKNLNRKIWEIAIEIKSAYCHQGYGYRALKMYLETVANISNRHEFSSRVDTDNIASQNLMEKLGFQPYGLSEFLLHREEDKKVAEEEYKDKLDDRYMALAKKFEVEPRKLLSHVLEYRIVV